MLIKNHKDLASHIKGKKIIHLNSLGKDSVVCLEWLANYAEPLEIISVHYEFMSKHPDDELYLNYLKKRFHGVKFLKEPNPHELTNIALTLYQSPIDVMTNLNKFEYDRFAFKDYNKCLLEREGFDYICSGFSRYESVARAQNFHKKGICIDDQIFPIGMMSKKEIIQLIKNTGIKLHPCYKYAQSTFDYPSYYKMRSAFFANPNYKKSVFKVFPMLELDEFRYEVLLK